MELWETREPWLEVREHIDWDRGEQKSGWMIFYCRDGGLGLDGSRIETSTYCLEGKFGGLPDTFVGFHPSKESALKAIDDAGMSDRLIGLVGITGATGWPGHARGAAVQPMNKISELIEQPLVTTEPLSPEQAKMVDEHMARREAVAKEMEEEKVSGSIWPSLKEVRRACLEGAGLIERGAPLPPAAPLALTDRNIAALSRAIEAEGYTILVDPETGDVKLERRFEAFEVKLDGPVLTTTGRPYKEGPVRIEGGDLPPHAISTPDYPALVTDALRRFPLGSHTEKEIVGKIMQERGGNADPTRIIREIKWQTQATR